MTSTQLSPVRQVLTCLATCGALFSSGLTLAIPSVTTSHQIIPQEQYWIVNISSLSVVGGSLIVAPILDRYGVKICLIICLMLSITGWSLLSGGIWLVFGRILDGLSVGIAAAPTSFFLAEVPSPRLRAALTTFKHAALSLGILVMHCLGLYFGDNWRSATISSAVIVLVCLLAVILSLPNSRSDCSNGGLPLSIYGLFFTALTKRADVWKPFILMAGITSINQFSGCTIILSYAAKILRLAATSDEKVGAVSLGALRVVASLLAVPLAGCFGRRTLSTYGCYMSSVAFILIAGGKEGTLYLLLIFVFTSTLASSAFEALIGEVFLPEFRAVSTGLTSTATFASSYAALYYHPWLETQVTFRTLLGIYAATYVTGALVCILFLKDNVHSAKQREVIPPREAEIEASVPLQERNHKDEVKA